MKHKRLTIALIASTVAAMILVATLSVYAYFTTRVYVYTEDGKEVAHVGMNLQLLFGKLSGVTPGTNLGIPSYNVVDANGNIVYSDGTTTSNDTTNKGAWANATTGTTQYLHYNDGTEANPTPYDPDAPWGSAQNPYIISEARHLQNLSALQNVGYFDLLYVANNFDTNGNYIAGSASIPYFLICTDTTSTTSGAVAGRPITISGTELAAIKPIGSAEHPFIGVIGGAFTTGTTTVIGADTTATTDDKTSSVSAIHGFKVQTNTNQTDVGLFGYVGFLGKEPTTAELTEAMKVTTYVPAFEGVFSSIQDMLISDVQVTVASPTLGENISELFMPFWEKFFGNGDGTVADGEVLHRFTFSGESNAAELFHETHHIGIFAGHVSYALIDDISVYYSDNSIYALDVTGVKNDNGDPTGNYYSASGILGMMYNMNCTVQNPTDGGNCIVLLGTGTSNEEVGTGGEGTGTGGGALSGNGRGYVTAAEIFSDFNNVDVTKSNNELLWRYRIGSAWTNNAILLLQKADGTYTMLDGTTPATFSGNTVTIGTGETATTYTGNFFIRQTFKNTQGEDMLRYVTPADASIDECELMGNNENGQTIWKFTAGGDAVWHYGIRVFKDGTSYTLEDGTPVTFDGKHIVLTDTTTGATTVWESFFVSDKTAGATTPHYMYDSALDKNWTVTTFERKPLTLIEAVNSEGEELCIEWVSTFLIWETQTGLYYFYDGVFTFGLSSPEDTVRDTWLNDEAPTLYLGTDDPTKWQINPATDNKAVVALLKPIKSNAEMDDAVKDKKQFYISAKPTSENDALLMSLLTQNKDGKPGSINGTMLQFDTNNELANKLLQSYQRGDYTQKPLVPTVGSSDQEMTVDLTTMQTPEFWAQYDILNLGRTSDNKSLSVLRTQYNVVAGHDTSVYEFFDEKTGAHVVPNGANVPIYYEWDGYFYFEYTTEVVRYGNYNFRTVFTFTYFYQSPEDDGGEIIEIGTSTYESSRHLDNTPATFSPEYINLTGILTPKTDAEGAYARESNEVVFCQPGSDIYRPLVNLYGEDYPIFYDSADTDAEREAIISGTDVAKDTGSTTGYYYYNITDVSKQYYNSSNNPVDAATMAQNPNYKKLIRYPTYTFSNSTGQSSLQMLREYLGTFWLFVTIPYGNKYSIWAGDDTQYTNLELERDHNKNGVLVFEPGKEYCYIRYALDSNSQYVQYSYDSSTKSGTYSGAMSNQTQNTRLYVYVIEGIIDMDYGVNTFIPVTNAENPSVELSAGNVVFWPQMTLTSTGYNTNTGYKTKVTSTNSNDINATKDSSADPVYSIVPLTGDNGLNWGDSQGYFLGANGKHGLTQKFQLADQTGFGPMLNLGDLGEIPIGDEANTMIAPVGSNGVEANVPKGCVAFRVNSGGKQTIRVIVAVPTTDKHLGESGFELDMGKDYYIGVWQVEAAGDSFIQTFSKSAALEKFELPRSYTFNYEETPESVEDNATKPYVNVQYSGKNYRTYLNGDCFLVAYEFTVSGEGVYVIGSVHGTDNAVTEKDVPMEIVHFSVSGTASAGRDGVTGNQLGAIDFVYDDAVTTGTGNAATTTNTIITVNRTAGTNETGTTNANGENYANYYASQCLLYTNNEAKTSSGGFLDLSAGKVWIRRYVVPDTEGGTTGTTKIACGTSTTTAITDPFLVKRYAINSDAVILNDVEHSG